MRLREHLRVARQPVARHVAGSQRHADEVALLSHTMLWYSWLSIGSDVSNDPVRGMSECTTTPVSVRCRRARIAVDLT